MRSLESRLGGRDSECTWAMHSGIVIIASVEQRGSGLDHKQSSLLDQKSLVIRTEFGLDSHLECWIVIY